jgi:hypothetical protein
MDCGCGLKAEEAGGEGFILITYPDAGTGSSKIE